MKAVVLAGGFGTRLKQRVPDLPKPMAPIAGTPFLEYLLTQLVNADIEEIILSVGYLAHLIQDHFQDSFLGTPLRYVHEDTPLGTGGALALASRSFEDDHFLAVNGDTFIDVDFARLIQWFDTSEMQTAIVLKQLPDISRYGSIEVTEDVVTAFLEKGMTGPGLINAGVYFLSPDLFNRFELTGNFSLETDFFQQHIDSLKPGAYITEGWFIDIGIPEDYEKAQVELPNKFKKT